LIFFDSQCSSYCSCINISLVIVLYVVVFVDCSRLNDECVVNMQSNSSFLKCLAIRRQTYGYRVDNTAEENSSIFFLVRLRWLPSARQGQQRRTGSKTLHQQNPGGAG